MCAFFFSFSFCLFLSLLSGLSHQDYSSILLSFPNTIAKGCVLSFPLAFSVQQLLCHSWCSPLSCGRDSESPPPGCHLSPLFNWQLLGRLVFSPLLCFLLLTFSPCPSLSLTCVTPSPCRNFNSFCHKKDKKKKKSLCVIFPREEVTRTFFLYSHPCVFTTGAQQIYLLAHKRSSHLLKQGRTAE